MGSGERGKGGREVVSCGGRCWTLKQLAVSEPTLSMKARKLGHLFSIPTCCGLGDWRKGFMAGQSTSQEVLQSWAKWDRSSCTAEEILVVVYSSMDMVLSENESLPRALYCNSGDLRRLPSQVALPPNFRLLESSRTWLHVLFMASRSCLQFL